MYFREARDQFLLEFNSIQFAQNFARLLAEYKKKKKIFCFFKILSRKSMNTLFKQQKDIPRV